jgi:hypothetical protein
MMPEAERLVPVLSLTDAQMTAVMDAARPLPEAARDDFLQGVAEVFAARGSVPADGDLHRLLHELQRAYFRPRT